MILVRGVACAPILSRPKENPNGIRRQTLPYRHARRDRSVAKSPRRATRDIRMQVRLWYMVGKEPDVDQLRRISPDPRYFLQWRPRMRMSARRSCLHRFGLISPRVAAARRFPVYGSLAADRRVWARMGGVQTRANFDHASLPNVSARDQMFQSVSEINDGL